MARTSVRLSRRRVLTALALLVLAAVATFAFQAWRAGSALVRAQDLGETLTRQLNAGDLRAARRTAADLADATRSAHGHTDGPLWDLGRHVPVAGHTVGAVQTSAEVLDAIAAHSLPTLLDLAREVDSGRLRPHDGRVDLVAVRDLAPSVRRAAADVDGAAARMAEVRPDRVVPPLDGVVAELRTRVGDARAAIDAAADAFAVLPEMLGGDGRTRSYLLLVQNNAEIRSTGGMPGSWSVLHARDGRVWMGRQSDAAGFRSDVQPIRLTTEEAALFGGGLGLDPRDITVDPDFPRVARMAAGLARAQGVRVDGVFAVDPIALALVLRGTGAIPVGPVTIDANTAVPVLLNGIYRNIASPVGQNDFFALAARRAFDALVGGQGDQVRAIRGLVLAAGQHRVLAWSADPKVAAVIADNALSGALAGDDGTTPHVGLYLSDGGSGKMQYFLRQSAELRAVDCADDGTQRLRLTATLRSTATDAVATSSPYVTGAGELVPRGTMLMNLRLYGPWRGTIDAIAVDGEPVTVTANRHDGHQVGTLPVTLGPGDLVRVTATMTTGAGQSGEPVLTATPGMESTRNPSTYPTSCG